MPSVSRTWKLEAQYAPTSNIKQSWILVDDGWTLLRLQIFDGYAVAYAFAAGNDKAIDEDRIPIGAYTQNGLQEFAELWREDVLANQKSRNYWASALEMPPGAFMRWWRDELNTKKREEAPAEVWNRVQMIDKSAIRPAMAECPVCGSSEPHGPHDLVGATIEGAKVMSAKVGGVEDKMTLEFHLDGIEHALSSGRRFWVRADVLGAEGTDVTESVKAMYEKLTAKPTVMAKDGIGPTYVLPMAMGPTEDDQLPWHVQWTATLDSFVQQMRNRAHRMGLDQDRLDKAKTVEDDRWAREQTALREQWANLDAERTEFVKTQKRWYGIVEDELGTLATPAELAAAILRLAQPTETGAEHG
jgi:hypothetical protein